MPAPRPGGRSWARGWDEDVMPRQADAGLRPSGASNPPDRRARRPCSSASASGIRLLAREAVGRLVDADHPVVGERPGELDRAVAHAAAGVEDQRRLAIPSGQARRRRPCCNRDTVCGRELACLATCADEVFMDARLGALGDLQGWRTSRFYAAPSAPERRGRPGRARPPAHPASARTSPLKPLGLRQSCAAVD